MSTDMGRAWTVELDATGQHWIVEDKAAEAKAAEAPRE